MLNNPLIAKELIQAAHRKRNYAARVAIPLAAILISAPQVLDVLRRIGEDWRSIAQVARPIFETCSWVQLIGFSIAAFTYGAAALQQEWVNQTMEVLCTTPLSRFKIIYGKFVAVLSKLCLLWLSLLPVMGIWFYLGRIPRASALGSIAVIIGSAVFFGAIALTQACACRTAAANLNATALIILPWYVVIILLDAYVFVRNPFLEAAISPRALYLVLAATAPRGWSVGGFALLSMGLHVGLSAFALAAAPVLFVRSFGRHIGAVRRGRFLERLRRFTTAKRKPIKERESPFAWQEKGAPTRLLPWILWIVYAVTLIFVLGYAVKENEFDDIFFDNEFYIIMFIAGMIVLPLVSVFYGATIFARDKARRRTAPLLLTGHRAQTFLWAKVVAVYGALWTSIAFLVLFGIILAHTETPLHGDETIFALCAAECIIFGPAICVIIGMAFSLTARSATTAIMGLLSSIVWAILTAFAGGIFMMLTHWNVPEPCLLLVSISIGVLLVMPWRWSPLLCGLLLAAQFWFVIALLASVNEAVRGRFGESAMFVASVVAVAGFTLIWYLMAVRMFDRAMAGEAPRLWRRARG